MSTCATSPMSRALETKADRKEKLPSGWISCVLLGSLGEYEFRSTTVEAEKDQERCENEKEVAE